nr:hypothetical protein [Tanacetum cinerariifolium]
SVPLGPVRRAHGAVWAGGQSVGRGAPHRGHGRGGPPGAGRIHGRAALRRLPPGHAGVGNAPGPAHLAAAARPRRHRATLRAPGRFTAVSLLAQRLAAPALAW